MKECKNHAGRKVMAKSLCSACYQEERVKNMPPCNVEGCQIGQTARGLCQTHYRRLRSGMFIEKPIRYKESKPKKEPFDLVAWINATKLTGTRYN